MLSGDTVSERMDQADLGRRRAQHDIGSSSLSKKEFANAIEWSAASEVDYANQ